MNFASNGLEKLIKIKLNYSVPKKTQQSNICCLESRNLNSAIQNSGNNLAVKN